MADFEQTLAWNTWNEDVTPRTPLMMVPWGQYATQNCATLLGVKITAETVSGGIKWTAQAIEGYHAFRDYSTPYGDGNFYIKLRVDGIESDLAFAADSVWQYFTPKSWVEDFNGSMWGEMPAGATDNDKVHTGNLATVTVSAARYSACSVTLVIRDDFSDGYGGRLYDDAEIPISFASGALPFRINPGGGKLVTPHTFYWHRKGSGIKKGIGIFRNPDGKKIQRLY